MEEAISGAQYAIHAVPVQHSRVFLESVKVRVTKPLHQVLSCSSPANELLPVQIDLFKWTSPGMILQKEDEVIFRELLNCFWQIH